MNLSMIPAEIDPRVKTKLDRQAAEAADRLEEARSRAAANFAAYESAFDAWVKATGEAADRLWIACDQAYRGALSATAARQSAQRRMDELENPTLVAQIARQEQEKRERFDELRRMREAEAEAGGDTAVTRVRESAPRGDYPQVVDNGDGLAQLDRETLRTLSRENGLSVAGHKAVVIERLREAGVTA